MAGGRWQVGDMLYRSFFILFLIPALGLALFFLIDRSAPLGWFILASIFVALVSFSALKLKSRAMLRAERGCCASCGYDLTGNISGRCPECGNCICSRAD